MAYNYPEISVETIMTLRVLIKDLRTNNKLLDESPYDDITKQTLKQLLTNSSDSIKSQNESKSLEDLDYESETMSLYNSLNEIDNFDAVDVKERISVIKLKTSILQDLLNMMKESKRIKDINRFTELVYSILTEEQKNKLLES